MRWVLCCCFAFALNKAFATIRPIFRERGKINAEVTGRLTESLGGVRVIKGYHAEEREESIFAAGVQAAARQRHAHSDRDFGDEPFRQRSAGRGGRRHHVRGRAPDCGGTLTAGGFFSYTLLLGFLVAPIMQIVAIGTQLTEALAGLERTQEIMRERPEDQDPRRTVTLRDIVGTVEFDDVSFSYDGIARSVCTTSRFAPSRAR